MAITVDEVITNTDEKTNKWLVFARNNASILIIYFFVFLLAAIASVFSDRFLTASNLLNILRQSVVLGLLALGQMAVLLTGGMDISEEQVARLVGLLVATAICRLRQQYNADLPSGCGWPAARRIAGHA